MNSKIMTTAEAARYLNVVPNTVRGYESRGLLPANRTATGVRIFCRHEVEAFANRRDGKRRTGEASDKRRAVEKL